MINQPIPADASAVILEAYIRVLEVRLASSLDLKGEELIWLVAL